jgi:hypothetical protein
MAETNFLHQWQLNRFQIVLKFWFRVAIRGTLFSIPIVAALICEYFTP